MWILRFLWFLFQFCMNQDLSVGFIGFGEAGSHIAKGLRSAGLTRIVAFDIDPERVRRNSEETGTPLLASNRQLAEAAQILISTVTCARAKEAAEQTAPFLRSHHIYADLNSVSPGLKQDIEKIVSAAGADFVEA